MTEKIFLTKHLSNNSRQNIASLKLSTEIITVQNNFSKEFPGLKLIVKKQDNISPKKVLYSCTVSAIEFRRNNEPGIGANFVVPASDFSLKIIKEKFKKIQSQDWRSLADTDKEALKMITERNKGKVPKELIN